MKPTSFFFACSLAVNAVLAGIFWFRPAPPTSTPETFVRTTDAMGGISEGTKQLLSETKNENLEHLRDRLLAEGLPAAIVEQIIKARLWSAHEARVEAADPIGKRPWWQQTQTQLPGDDIRMERLRETSREKFRAQMDRLFPGYTQTIPAPAASFLSAATRDTVQQLTADYEELRTKLRAEAGSPYEFEEDRKKMDYLREEEDEDLRALLSEGEYKEFKLRGPGSEEDFKKKAALMNMSENEFRGMLAISAWMEEQNEKFPHLTNPFADRSPEQLEEGKQLQLEREKREREFLGPERYSLYLRVDDHDYETISRYVARHDLPPSRITEYIALSDSVTYQAWALVSQDSPLAQRQEAGRALAKTARASLQTLTGSQSTEGLKLHEVIRQLESADW